MNELTQIPEWMGVAVIGAIIAALGYVGKLLIESWLAIRNTRNLRRSKLVELQSLLSAAWSIFATQNAQAKRLTSMIEKNHVDLIVNNEGYESILSKAHKQFTQEEMELHEIIRNVTIYSLLPTNKLLLEWIKTDTYFKAQHHSKNVLSELAKHIAALEAHLLLWLAKYEAWIPNNAEHALVYLDDEAKHGIGFPSGIDKLVEKALEQRFL